MKSRKTIHTNHIEKVLKSKNTLFKKITTFRNALIDMGYNKNGFSNKASCALVEYARCYITEWQNAYLKKHILPKCKGSLDMYCCMLSHLPRSPFIIMNSSDGMLKSLCDHLWWQYHSNELMDMYFAGIYVNECDMCSHLSMTDIKAKYPEWYEKILYLKISEANFSRLSSYRKMT